VISEFLGENILIQQLLLLISDDV